METTAISDILQPRLVTIRARLGIFVETSRARLHKAWQHLQVSLLPACMHAIGSEGLGGFPVVATVDEGPETVYVANNDDGTVSVFPSSR